MLGSTTRLHSIYGRATKLKGVKCFFCYKPVWLKSGKPLSELIVYSQIYCDSCALQAREGIIKMGQTSHVSRWYTKKCLKCGKPIGKIYDFCYDCDPNKYFRRPAEPKPKEPPKKRDTTYLPDNTLKKTLAYCQNLECSNRGKPHDREEMWKLKRRMDMRDEGKSLQIFFCSEDCAKQFLNNQEKGLRFFIYKKFGNFREITS